MKLAHIQKRTANRSFNKNTTIPKGVTPWAKDRLLSPKPNSQTQRRKRELEVQRTQNK
jgi:hypothetical protein